MLEPDPRIYFAAERTLLAWVRTGVTVVGLGFIVARFGLFLRLLNPAHPDIARTTFSGILGSALTLFGGIMTALAVYQFLVFIRELAPRERPRMRISATLSVVLASVVSAVGILLGIYLLA